MIPWALPYEVTVASIRFRDNHGSRTIGHSFGNSMSSSSKTKISWMLLVAAPIIFPTAAMATVQVSENEGWVISYNTDDKVCVATPRTDGGLFFMGSLDGRLDLIFRSQDLAWVGAGKAYPFTIYTDRKSWSGSMRGLQDLSGVSFAGATGEFLSALRAASEVSLEILTVRLGPYSLAGSATTLEAIQECVVAAKNGKFTPAQPVDLPLNDVLEWNKDDYGKPFVAQGWTAVLKGQDNKDGTLTTFLEARNRQGHSLTVELEGTSGELGVFPFHEAQVPSIYFSALSDGAHCCTSALAIVNLGDLPKRIEVGRFDGGGPSPLDIDGDGVFELYAVDQRHLNAFGPYATSFPPHQILTLSYQGDKFDDVTSQPEFRLYLRRRFVENYNRYKTLAGDDTAQSAIAGILASASQLNLFPAFRDSMALQLSRKPADGYDACRSPDCSPEKNFKTLFDMVSDRFGQWGYTTASTFSPETTAFFNDLGSQSTFGDKTEGSEISCEGGAYRFKVLETGAISFSGYEIGCDVESAVTQENTSVVSAFCDAVGEVSFENYMFTRTANGLKVSQWRDDVSGAASQTVEFKPCG